MEISNVMSLLSLYSGEEPQGDRETLFAALSKDAVNSVLSILKNRPLSDELTSAAESFAAASALYQLALIDDAASPESLSADGVSLRIGQRSERAKKLRDEKLKNLKQLLNEENFYFASI